MAQHDYSIANGTGAAVRSDLNDALSAIVSLNSGASEPATTFAFQLWADTTNNLLKLRNSANNAWITLRQLDGDFSTVSVDNGTAAAPSVFFNASGTDTGFYSSGTDAVDVSTAGTRRLGVGSSGDVTVFGGNVTLNAQGDLRFADSDSSNWVAFQAPATVASNVTWTLPSADGTADQALTTNGSGVLSWADAGGTADAITEGNTSAEVVDTGSDGHFKVVTEGSERLRIDSQGRCGIGQSNPQRVLDLKTTEPGIRLTDSDNNIYADIYSQNGDLYFEVDPGSNQGNSIITFDIDGSERVRMDSVGRLLVGTSSARSNVDTPSGNATPFVQFETLGNNYNSGLSLINNSSGTYGPVLTLGATTGTSIGSNTIVSNGQYFGTINFVGADGTNLIEGASIRGEVAGTPGTNDMPGRLVFYTTADGASSSTERMRISQDGTIFIAKTQYGLGTAGHELHFDGKVYHSSSVERVLIVNKLGADGILVGFYHATTEEGNISVSGSTVSYNGGHLSRWSQLPGNAERIEILRGSVLSNIDEMCVWAYDAEPEVLWGEGDELPEGVSVGDVKTPAKSAGTELNEQLNRMKVSDVEGDPNVAGVFQCWDDADDIYTNDFYCAMTGDFVIRIAQGVTVERGDLLMSAGDGTAKPQEDDIIRSKTIAKVTSTNVSCTYDDGSYCVPCVLMAC